jgi:ABC-type thiamine transport system substrate-binding protein
MGLGAFSAFSKGENPLALSRNQNRIPRLLRPNKNNYMAGK